MLKRTLVVTAMLIAASTSALAQDVCAGAPNCGIPLNGLKPNYTTTPEQRGYVARADGTGWNLPQKSSNSQPNYNGGTNGGNAHRGDRSGNVIAAVILGLALYATVQQTQQPQQVIYVQQPQNPLYEERLVYDEQRGYHVRVLVRIN